MIDGKEKTTPLEQVQVGDLLSVKSGEAFQYR